MSRDLLVLGEAWGLFADRLFASRLRTEAAGKAKVGKVVRSTERAKEFRS